MSRAMLEKIKSYYEKGIYKIGQIGQMQDAGKLTREEYLYVTGGENDDL